MAAPTLADIQAHFPVSEVGTSYIEYALEKAAVEVAARVGADAYADAIAGTPTDLTVSAFITEAVELFTMARLMRNTGLRFRKNGFVVKETDAGSPAMGGGSQITNEYLKPSEQIALAEDFRKQAMDALNLAGVSDGKDLHLFVNVSDTETANSIRKLTSSQWNE